MFEYWIFESETSNISAVIKKEEDKEEGLIQESGDYVWYFQANNIFVIQSHIPFGDGNLLLDDVLITLAKRFQVQDKGIIKSCW
ncbi:hypothetical protein KUV80_02410 [Fictibacillus nanhaiensis]|uniref:hypothetical protein n=1 Tax=Fictibacillus nanhaiensis TaxID=742169 RepID=UPI001C971E3A|nr:hypothetical protein [Fictibacillus nanhaiensis]MBY6035482.1 hypothetical protein [Fictibacillus nanhaiensis]